MIDKLKDNITNLIAVIGVVGTIGAGFTVYGTMNEKIAQLESNASDVKPFNPDPLIVEIGKNRKFMSDNATRIAVLEKTIQVLELEIKELKVNSKNPLAN
jgi:hypothetical protein